MNYTDDNKEATIIELTNRLDDMTRLYDEVSTQYNECLRVIREAGLIISAYWDYGGSDMYCWKWQWYDSDVVHTGYASRAEALIAALQSLIHERDSSPG